MIRWYAPPEGGEEFEGWDQYMSLRPADRIEAMPKVCNMIHTRRNTDPSGAWLRGWMDAWDTIRAGYGARFRALE